MSNSLDLTASGARQVHPGAPTGESFRSTPNSGSRPLLGRQGIAGTHSRSTNLGSTSSAARRISRRSSGAARLPRRRSARFSRTASAVNRSRFRPTQITILLTGSSLLLAPLYLTNCSFRPAHRCRDISTSKQVHPPHLPHHDVNGARRGDALSVYLRQTHPGAALGARLSELAHPLAVLEHGLGQRGLEHRELPHMLIQRGVAEVCLSRTLVRTPLRSARPVYPLRRKPGARKPPLQSPSGRVRLTRRSIP